MRDLHLTPENLLPVITPQDKVFADIIADQYDLPLDKISWLIRYVRNEIQDDFSEYMKDSRLKETYQELFASGTEIIGISIKTNKGAINIKTSDSLFDLYFKTPIQRIRLNFKETLNSELDFLQSLTKRTLFGKIMMYFDGTSLIDFRKNNAIGKFLIHFKLYKGKPIMTETEWNEDPTNDQDYKHYLDSIVKSRKRKYLIEYNI